MNRPKVSVIVPVYNTEKYLENCLNSLVNQTLKDIEIVVIDDGSTDSSPQIIKRFVEENPEKFVFESQKNSGQASARNRGVARCNGEYIGFLDSDDECVVSMFEKMYNAASENDADAVICDYWYVTYKNKKEVNLKIDNDNKKMLIDCFVDPWNKLYRAEILKDNKITFPEGYFYEDTGWFAKTVPFIGTKVKINEPLVLHYKREGSTMNALDDKRVAHIFPVMDDVLSFYRQSEKYNAYKTELEYFYAKILLCSSMRRISRVKDTKIRKELVKTTFQKLKENFPKYKENEYFSKGKTGIYIRIISEKNAFAVLTAYKMLNFLAEKTE